MASGAVRELITKIKFVLDRASEQKVKSAVQGIKKQLAALNGKQAKLKINADTARATAAISSLKVQLAALNGKTATTYVQTKQKGASAGTAAKGGGGASKANALADNAGTIAATGAGMLGALVFPIKEAIDFESAMADVRKVVDFDTPEQFAQMGRDIEDLSTKLPMTKEQIAAIVAAGGQSGIERENLLAFAEAAAKMGVAFDISAEQAGQSMAKWRTGMGLTQEGVEELADKINYLSNNTAASASAISDVVTRVGALAQTVGLASGETAAIAASMIGAGARSDVAATALQNLMLNLQSGESATKSQAEAFEKLGLDAVEMAKRLKVDAKGAIIEVFKRIKQLDGYRQSSVMEDLLGRESIEALAPMLGQLENLEKNLGMVADASKYAGSMQKEFDARNATTANSLQRLRNQIDKTAGVMGKNLLPVLERLSGILFRATKFIGDFAREYPNLTSAILIAVGALGSLLVVVGTLGILLGGVMTAVETLGPLFAGVFGGLSGMLAPILVGLVAVASLIYTVKENWDTVVALFRPGLESMMTGLESLKTAWENIQPFITALMPLIRIIAQLIGSVIVANVLVMWNLFTAAFRAIAALIEMVTSLLGGLGNAIQTIGAALGGLIDRAREFIGMKGQIEGVNTSVTQKWADAAIAKATGGDTSSNTEQNYTFNVGSWWEAKEAYRNSMFVSDYQ